MEHDPPGSNPMVSSGVVHCADSSSSEIHTGCHQTSAGAHLAPDQRLIKRETNYASMVAFSFGNAKIVAESCLV